MIHKIDSNGKSREKKNKTSYYSTNGNNEDKKEKQTEEKRNKHRIQYNTKKKKAFKDVAIVK